MMNYKHLRYFWVVAKYGSLAKASDYLHLTPQTLSGQISTLEDRLGQKLFTKRGRNLALTDVGEVAKHYADQIFAIGNELEARMTSSDLNLTTTLRVGIAGAVPKSIARRLILPALDQQTPVQLKCNESSLENLLADLALHRLDFVLADSPIPQHLGIKGVSSLLGQSTMSFMAKATLYANQNDPFPECLNSLPFLIPSDASKANRDLLNWFNQQKLRPKIAGEFDDSALMKSFGQQGLGVFAVPTAIANEVAKQFEVEEIGRSNELKSSFYFISNEQSRDNGMHQKIIAGAALWLEAA